VVQRLSSKPADVDCRLLVERARLRASARCDSHLRPIHTRDHTCTARAGVDRPCIEGRHVAGDERSTAGTGTSEGELSVWSSKNSGRGPDGSPVTVQQWTRSAMPICLSRNAVRRVRVPVVGAPECVWRFTP
jgi:hypothetical protein